MMKRLFSTLLLLCLLCTVAAAEPRYPAKAGVTTDVAAVLSHETLEDLRTLDSRLDKADALRLYIVTVDFLDAQPVQDYADALFDRWNLDDDELLLLIAVGEESCAIAAGRNANRLLAPATQAKLMAGSFTEPFLAQRFDEAVSAFVPALVREINKVCGTSVSTDGLFSRKSDSLIVDWAGSLLRDHDDDEDDDDSVLTREDRRTGFSVLKVVAIVAILLVAFGSFGRKGKAPRKEKPQQQTQYFTKKPADRNPTPQYFKPRH